jgi:ADP-ribose pyrophosphatase YjhB (NUDIX family)
LAEKSRVHWLDWAREIAAISQTGLHYALGEYDRQRYLRLQSIAAEMITSCSNISYDDLLVAFTSQKGYATPKVDVRAAVFNEGKILMVRERSDGGWTLPGGWADVGDIPSQTAEREAWEEAGFRVQARKVIGVYDANRGAPMELFHAFKIIFLCDLIDGQPTTSYETSEVQFFSMDMIPEQLSGERTRLRHIQDAFIAYGDPNLPTVFD